LDVAGIVVSAAFVETKDDCVLFHSVGFVCTDSMIFFTKPSHKVSLEVAGCPSVKPLGWMIETFGRVPAASCV
jgi:hypothetical protein